jgi:hypothetical protein
VDLRGMPESHVEVEIRLVTRDGRVIDARRVYHTCRGTRFSPSRPPEL